MSIGTGLLYLVRMMSLKSSVQCASVVSQLM